MLLLEFSILPKTTGKLKLTTVHQAAKINNFSKHTRLLNTKNISPTPKTTPGILLEETPGQNTRDDPTARKDPSKTAKVEKGKRPRGRPRKVRAGDNGNLLDKFNNVSTYLEYARYRSLKTTSGVFMGNMYELQIKTYLEETFKIQSTLHQGGSNDKGIDINAIWSPTKVFGSGSKDKDKDRGEVEVQAGEKTRYEVVNSKRIKPLVQRTNQSLKLFVQCKCFNTSKIDPKLIREIKGSCQEYFKKHGNTAVFMLASTNGFTRIGGEDFEKAPIPMIYVRFSRPRLLNAGDPYELQNWQAGKLLGMRMNPLAMALFKGLDWINFAKRIAS